MEQDGIGDSQGIGCAASLRQSAGGLQRLQPERNPHARHEWPTGTWVHSDGVRHTIAFHNSLTDGAWFLPALSLLSAASQQGVVARYIGPETYDGVAVKHLRLWRLADSTQQAIANVIPRLSTVEIYLDSSSSLPVALAFLAHSERDMNTDVPVEIRFSDYRLVSGVSVPFHIQKYLMLLGCCFVFVGVVQQQTPSNVSLLQLITTPEKFDGTLVDVEGFLDMGREGDLLYLHQTDSENGLLSNAIWVRRTEEASKDKTRLNLKYVRVVGVFRARFKKQLGTPSGGIPEVRKVEIWSDPAHPFKDKLKQIPGVDPNS